MRTAYLVLAALIVSAFSYDQYNYWSLYSSDAGTRKPSRLSSSSTGTRGK